MGVTRCTTCASARIDGISRQIPIRKTLKAARTSYFGRMRAKLISDGRSRGFTVVDLEQAFLASFAKDGLRFEPFDDMVSAIAREKQLKKWKRDWKLSLIEVSNPGWVDLAEGLGFVPKR